MNELQVKALMMFINAGMKILSTRIILGITLLLVFSLFAWAMLEPTHERIGIATIFALFVFLPVIRADSRESETKKATEGE